MRRYHQEMLSYKVVTLLTILSGQRVSTVHKLRISQLHISEDIAFFYHSRTI